MVRRKPRVDTEDEGLKRWWNKYVGCEYFHKCTYLRPPTITLFLTNSRKFCACETNLITTHRLIHYEAH